MKRLSFRIDREQGGGENDFPPWFVDNPKVVPVVIRLCVASWKWLQLGNGRFARARHSTSVEEFFYEMFKSRVLKTGSNLINKQEFSHPKV